MWQLLDVMLKRKQAFYPANYNNVCLSLTLEIFIFKLLIKRK